MSKYREHLACDFIKCISDALKTVGVENSYNMNCHSLKGKAVLWAGCLSKGTSFCPESRFDKISTEGVSLLNTSNFSPGCIGISVAHHFNCSFSMVRFKLQWNKK